MKCSRNCLVVCECLVFLVNVLAQNSDLVRCVLPGDSAVRCVPKIQCPTAAHETSTNACGVLNLRSQSHDSSNAHSNILVTLHTRSTDVIPRVSEKPSIFYSNGPENSSDLKLLESNRPYPYNGIPKHYNLPKDSHNSEINIDPVSEPSFSNHPEYTGKHNGSYKYSVTNVQPLDLPSSYTPIPGSDFNQPQLPINYRNYQTRTPQQIISTNIVPFHIILRDENQPQVNLSMYPSQIFQKIPRESTPPKSIPLDSLNADSYLQVKNVQAPYFSTNPTRVQSITHENIQYRASPLFRTHSDSLSADGIHHQTNRPMPSNPERAVTSPYSAFNPEMDNRKAQGHFFPSTVPSAYSISLPVQENRSRVQTTLPDELDQIQSESNEYPILLNKYPFTASSVNYKQMPVQLGDKSPVSLQENSDSILIPNPQSIMLKRIISVVENNPHSSSRTDTFSKSDVPSPSRFPDSQHQSTSTSLDEGSLLHVNNTRINNNIYVVALPNETYQIRQPLARNYSLDSDHTSTPKPVNIQYSYVQQFHNQTQATNVNSTLIQTLSREVYEEQISLEYNISSVPISEQIRFLRKIPTFLTPTHPGCNNGKCLSAHDIIPKIEQLKYTPINHFTQYSNVQVPPNREQNVQQTNDETTSNQSNLEHSSNSHLVNNDTQYPRQFNISEPLVIPHSSPEYYTNISSNALHFSISLGSSQKTSDKHIQRPVSVDPFNKQSLYFNNQTSLIPSSNTTEQYHQSKVHQRNNLPSATPAYAQQESSYPAVDSGFRSATVPETEEQEHTSTEFQHGGRGSPDVNFRMDGPEVSGLPERQQKFGNNSAMERGERSAIMCAEYSRLVTQHRRASGLLPEDEPITIDVQQCDLANPLVVGGENTTAGEFPHMASLGYMRENGIDWSCGATLISERFLITAAHCTYTGWGSPVVARLGVVYLKPLSTDTPQPLDVKISQTIRHPDYQPPARYHDIALIELEKPVALGRLIRPACLADENSPAQNMAVATGWGKVSNDGNTSNILLKVVLELLDLKHCNTFYESDRIGARLSRGVADTMLCAWSAGHGRDTCRGDSGGPLQIVKPTNRCVYQIIGITSFGKDCGIGVPAVYTRVSSYISWIEQIVWP